MAGRPPNTVSSKPFGLKLNQVTRDYLEAIANVGTHGNNWTDVVYRFIGEGIERAIRDNVIPRRSVPVSYETEK